jgi:gamma-glutamyltranspeptidase/glutathione hydrolase
VITRYGIVASEHPLASQVGAQILAQGGNAVDAAVAANAAMGVVAPMANGIGGDLFAIVYEAESGKLYGLNASGWSPADLSMAFLREGGFKNMPTTASIRHRARLRTDGKPRTAGEKLQDVRPGGAFGR